MNRPVARLTALLGLSLGAAGAVPLQVTSSTSLIADLVRAVGGARVQITTLVPANADVHTFSPATGDIRALSRSKTLFINGAGLEPWLPRIQAAAPGVPTVILSAAVKLRAADGGHDPHTWWNPQNAAAYIRRVQATLTRLDPAGKTTYAQNAARYVGQLNSLDRYARQQFASLPPASRRLVTNHDALDYLADRYGLKIVGEVISGLSTEREPSAQELARLITAVRAQRVHAIFTENTVNARLAQTLSQETGVKIAPPLYTDALGAPGSSGDSYLKAFRYNVDTIMKALK
ncbi:metal ABC transporter solute-binding protein, Zn/Mn family [Deinococcus sonorensis]|uniref:Zinc ABC transporter substrate-binding protein n=2 Tax=Deinococcus sonorensis TaxID=309891 RepID=A0AAU7U7D3_9DEIO